MVYVDHVARLSGGEIALLRILPALAAHVDVRVVLGEDGPLVARLQRLGIIVEVMPMALRLRNVRRESLRPGTLDAAALAQVPPYVLRLSRRLRSLKADIVHTNSLKAALYAGTAARIARVPAVWHVRDRIAADYLPRGAVTFVRFSSHILPTAIVVNSQATLDTLPRLGGGRISVVPDPVEQPPEWPPRQRSRIMVGVIGRLAFWKGQHIFLKSFAQAFVGTNVRGRIIGTAMFGEDNYARELHIEAERLGIADQIEFRGFRDDVWAELNELDILVHCSITPEPFGQVVLEGMAAGVPVVASGAGGPVELITSGVDGILTAPGDVGELAAALRRLHDDASLRTSLASAAKQRSHEFTPECTATRLVKVYRAIARS